MDQNNSYIRPGEIVALDHSYALAAECGPTQILNFYEALSSSNNNTSRQNVKEGVPIYTYNLFSILSLSRCTNVR